MNPDQTALREQSDLGPYCLQSTYADEKADDNFVNSWKWIKHVL